MKHILALVLAVFIVSNLASQTDDPIPSFLKTDDMQKLSVWIQQETFIERSKRLSFFLPGAGQIRNGDYGYGSLYLAGSLTVSITGIAFAYFLLPRDLQFGNLNLLTDDISFIEDTVKAHAFRDFLPSIAVLGTSGVLNLVLRFIAANHAEKQAREKIRAGIITFTPDPEILLRHFFRRPIPGMRGE